MKASDARRIAKLAWQKVDLAEAVRALCSATQGTWEDCLKYLELMSSWTEAAIFMRLYDDFVKEG